MRDSTYLNKSITKVYTISLIICSSNVTVKGLRIELGEDINFVNSTVDAITHWNINQPVASPDWYLSTIQGRQNVIK